MGITTTELGATSSNAPLLRISTAKYDFDENCDEWMLDGSIRLKLGIFSELGVEPKTLTGFRKSLSRYAQELSSSHCENIFYRVAHFFRTTEFKSFSAEALSSYRASLDDEHMWYLGVIRGFLDSWSEYGFPGVTQKAIDYLDGLTIKGNSKGVAVLMNCPYSGPYTALEHQSLIFGLANAYESRQLSQEGYSFLLAVSMTGRRPSQIRYLKLCDLALERNHVLEAGTLGNRDRRVGDARVLVGDVFDEQQDEHVVLVLAGVHAAAQLVAGGPEGGIKFGFLRDSPLCS